MSLLITAKAYDKKIEKQKAKALKEVKKILDLKYTYGTLPYMLDVELAIRAVENIRP